MTRPTAPLVKLKRRSGSDDEVIHSDNWGPGLHYGHKALNARSVARAKNFDEVIREVLRHTLRIDNEKHRHKRPPDRARTCLNEVLVGPATPDQGAQEASKKFKALGIAPSRWDNIAAVEIVVQPPDGWGCDEFWNESLTWVGREVGPIFSAVVHRDQDVPHMHVIVLAIQDGQLAGSALTTGDCSLPARQKHFTQHMRATFGLRADRTPGKAGRRIKGKRSMAAIFTSPGKGPRRHEEAKRSDAKFERRASEQWAKRLVGQEVAPTSCARPLIAHRLRSLSSLFASGVECGAFASTPSRPIEPTPRPAATLHGTEVGTARSATLIVAAAEPEYA